jgi:hypothetical protein
VLEPGPCRGYCDFDGGRFASWVWDKEFVMVILVCFLFVSFGNGNLL